jgi:hypothetical protein
MILDENENELVYWPISGLIEGENSQELTFMLEGPTSGKLVGTEDDRVTVFARPKGVGAEYQDISNVPIEVNIVVNTEYEIFVRANSPIEGLERVPVSVVLGSSNPAQW